jgi:hypothetical protein
MYRILIVALVFVFQVGGARSETRSDANRVQCERSAEPDFCAPSLKKLPQEVAAHVQGMIDLCREVKGEPLSGPTIEYGNLAAGLKFWAIFEDTLDCKGAATLYSGSHGSEVGVYVSAPDGQAKQAVVQGAYGMTIENIDSYSKIWLTVSGKLCGQRGDPSTAELMFCERALRWDSKAQKLEFAPLSEARMVPSDEQRGELRQGPMLERAIDASKPLFFQPAVHNGSQMRLSEWKNGTVEIAYDVPRPGLSVTKGTLLFRGVVNGRRYSGTAYNFKAGCPPSPYAVSGMRDDKKETIVLTGISPHRDPQSCKVIGASNRPVQRLVFDAHIDGDE